MPKPRAFTIVELLVVTTIFATLVGTLLPAVTRARDQARVALSETNLRNLATAHGAYAAAWNDRQLTFVNDGIAHYGDSVRTAFVAYWNARGGNGGNDLRCVLRMRPYAEATYAMHPPVRLGYGVEDTDDEYRMIAYDTGRNCANATLTLPIEFSGAGCSESLRYFGAFRLINANQFNQYVSGRFYDPVFYAPKDAIVRDAIATCLDSPEQFCDRANVDGAGHEIPGWSSYVMSPAAMFSPDVLRHGRSDDPFDPVGYTSPWSLPGGFRSPSFSQCRHPALKTHMLEHHWLQGAPSACNPGLAGTYGAEPGCEPYYFNHGWESTPATLFYDGHIEGVGVRRAMRADGRVRVQTGDPMHGLWSMGTPWGTDGYLIGHGYDQAASSYHILTTGGILGRDMAAE